MNFDAIMVRRAVDDFGAVRITHAMQSLDGVDVSSVVFKPDDRGGMWCVFAKYSSESISIKAIHEAIDNDDER